MHRLPIDAGGFHPDQRHPPLHEPVRPAPTTATSSCANSATSSRRPPAPSGVRAHAITVSRCTSKNAHRSTITFIIRPPSVGSDGSCRTGWRPRHEETEVRARSNRTERPRPPRQANNGLRSAIDARRLPDPTPTDSHPPRAAPPGAMGANTHSLASLPGSRPSRADAGRVPVAHRAITASVSASALDAKDFDDSLPRHTTSNLV